MSEVPLYLAITASPGRIVTLSRWPADAPAGQRQIPATIAGGRSEILHCRVELLRAAGRRRWGVGAHPFTPACRRSFLDVTPLITTIECCYKVRCEGPLLHSP